MYAIRSYYESLPLVHQGKVRDSYAVDDRHLLIVATDRLSAFDVLLPTPIPGKGRVLRITSYNVCYTKLLRSPTTASAGFQPMKCSTP